jgi:hypothetical protein
VTDPFWEAGMGQVGADRFEGRSGRPAMEISVVYSASGRQIRPHSIQRLDAEVKATATDRWPYLHFKWAVWPFESDQKSDDLAPPVWCLVSAIGRKAAFLRGLLCTQTGGKILSFWGRNAARAGKFFT